MSQSVDEFISPEGISGIEMLIYLKKNKQNNNKPRQYLKKNKQGPYLSHL